VREWTGCCIAAAWGGGELGESTNADINQKKNRVDVCQEKVPVLPAPRARGGAARLRRIADAGRDAGFPHGGSLWIRLRFGFSASMA
jgi:hypothetical protein